MSATERELQIARRSACYEAEYGHRMQYTFADVAKADSLILCNNRYPLPKKTQPRVYTDKSGAQWRVVDRVLEFRSGNIWRVVQMRSLADYKAIGALADNPTEEIEDCN